MTFEDHLRILTEMPSCFEMEAQVREYCETRLRSLRVTTECDGFGNLYAVRPGRRLGHFMFCAHMDKRMDANLLGPASKNGEVPIGPSGVSCLVDEQRCRFFESHEGRFREISLARESEGWMAPPTGQVVPDQGADVYALPVLAESDGLLFGKFDDALGLALILDLYEETRACDCPTVSALLTVGEERGLRGASYAVRNDTLYELNPGAIIVLDTCPVAEPGDGLILYEDCGRTRGDPTYHVRLVSRMLTDDLRRRAQQTRTRLTTLPPGGTTAGSSGETRPSRRWRWRSPSDTCTGRSKPSHARMLI